MCTSSDWRRFVNLFLGGGLLLGLFRHAVISRTLTVEIQEQNLWSKTISCRPAE